MQNQYMIDDILANLKDSYTIHDIEEFIKERYDIRFLKILGENEIYISDKNFSYMINVSENKLMYMEDNIICESCEGNGGVTIGYPPDDFWDEPCEDCNSTGLNNFYTKGEFILRTK